LVVGWIGILVILNPSQLLKINVEIENVSITVAFLGAIFTALAYVTVKKLSFTEDVYVIIEYFPLVSFITLLPIVLMNWVTPNWNELCWIIGIGLFTQLGQIFLTIGLKNLPASEASTINYLQVLFGSIWGILFFSEIININFLLGASLVLLGTIISTTASPPSFSLKISEKGSLSNNKQSLSDKAYAKNPLSPFFVLISSAILSAKTSSLSKSSSHSIHHCADIFIACVNEASLKFMVFLFIFDQNFIIDALKVFD